MTLHITANCKGNGVDIARTYSVNEGTFGDARKWASRQHNLTAQGIMEWLVNKGCQLDSPHDNTPAIVERYDDGSTAEYYYRYGKQHREHGPAYVAHYASGATEETYYRDGKIDKGMCCAPSGSRVDYPKSVGLLVDNPLSVIPGVTLQRRPAPKTSEKPSAPGLVF